MRVLLSTIGSRGDVQPLVALASELRALGQQVRLCVPPDFDDWIDSLGIPVTPIGPEVRKAAVASRPATPVPPSPGRQSQLVEAMAAFVANQFETIALAAEGCDIIVAATALQVAARDAERFNDTFGTALNSQWASAGLAPVSDVRQPHLHRPALAGRRPDVGPMALSQGPGRVTDGRLDPAGRASAVPRAGDVPRDR
jgi:Glycosyltransferase family 28 N-terminal domain